MVIILDTFRLWTIDGDAGYDRQAVVFYDATDGQEFFFCGVKLGTGSFDNGGFGAFKDTDGHWAIVTGPYGIAYDTVLNYWTGSTGPYDTDPVIDSTTTLLRPLMLRANISVGANNRAGFDNQIQSRWYPSNPALYSGLGTSGKMGNFVLIEGGTEAVIIAGYNSVAVRVPV